jgi:DNA-binding phage protein
VYAGDASPKQLDELLDGFDGEDTLSEEERFESMVENVLEEDDEDIDNEAKLR